AVEALDLAILVGDQRRPIESCALDGPAEATGVGEFFGEVRAIDQQLLRHTANVDAGAAQIAALRHGHAGAEIGGKTCRTHTAGTGTYDEEVEVVSHRRISLLGCEAYPTPPA